MARHRTPPRAQNEVEFDAPALAPPWADVYADALEPVGVSGWHGKGPHYDLWRGATRAAVYLVAARVQAAVEITHRSSAIARDLLKQELRADLQGWIDEAVEKRITALRGEFSTSRAPAEHDAVAMWMAAHQDEVQKYRGEMIAVHPTKGIVAHGPDLKTIHAIAKDLGVVDEVVFDAVPNL